MATVAQAVPQEAPAVNQWLATFVIMVGTLAAVMGSSTINTALPDIMSGLGISQDQVSWVATGYMLANVIAIPSAAWLGNLLSRRILFGVGVAGFLLGSILCGLSWDFSSMIGFRIFQGLGAGLIMPTAQALMFEIFPPHQRGTAMGIYGMGAIMGPALGPTVGGYLVGLFGWRSIFFINLPFAVLSILMLNGLPRGERKSGLRFDTPGFVSMVIWLCTLQIAISNGAKDGWDAPYIVFCFVASALSFLYLMYREMTTEAPLLDLHVFRHTTYNVATLISLVVGLGLFGSTFLVPVYMGSLLGYSAFQIGLIMLPGSLVMGVTMLFAGRLSDLIDNRILIAVGMALFCYYLYLQSLADVTSSESFYSWALVWRGLGMGLVFSPLSAVALNGLPAAQIAQGSGLFNLTRQLAGSVGIAALNTLLTTRSAFHFATLDQAMTMQSEATQRFVGAARQMLVTRGYAPDQAQMGALTMLGNAMKQRVMVEAFSDLFLICLAVSLLGLLPIAFMKYTAPRKA